MKSSLSYLLALPFIFSLVGCSIATERSDNVSQTRIYQHYSAHYSKIENRTAVTAAFKFGDVSGTTLELTGKSDIKHSAYPLSRTQFAGTYYSGSGAGFTDYHVFTYTNGDGNVFINSARITPITFKNLPNSFSSSTDLVVQWEGAALEKGEGVELNLADDTKSLFFSVSTAGSTEIILSREDLLSLSPGQKRISLTRTRTTDLQKATEVGGFFSTSYASEEQYIQKID